MREGNEWRSAVDGLCISASTLSLFYVELIGAESCVVSLPQMVASSTMDPESVGLLRDYVNKLFEYVFESQHLTSKS